MRGSCWDSGARQDESHRACKLLQQQQQQMQSVFSGPPGDGSSGNSGQDPEPIAEI
jgi:hypothetical protein